LKICCFSQQHRLQNLVLAGEENFALMLMYNISNIEDDVTVLMFIAFLVFKLVTSMKIEECQG
jgi:hypothetical protein